MFKLMLYTAVRVSELVNIRFISAHGNRKTLELYQHLLLAAIEDADQKAVTI